MKNNLFKHLVTGAMVMLTLGMTACGAGGASAIEGPTAEEDIVVKVGNVEIPLTSTWEEFEAIAKKSGWKIDESLYPVEDWWEISGMDYTNQGHVKAPQGELMVDTLDGRYTVTVERTPYNERK